MKKCIPFLASFFFSLHFFAQTVTVSEPLTVRNETNYDVIGNLFGNILIFRNEESDFKVQAFDEHLQMTWEKELDTDKKKADLLGVVSTLTDFTFFYHFRHKGEIIAKAQKYDAGANMIDSAEVKNFGRLFYTPNFNVIRSDDKSKTLIYYFEDGKKIISYCFDNEKMKLLWEKTLIPDDIIINRDFAQLLLDNDGNMHLILEKNNRKFKQEEHHFEIFEYGERNDFNLHRYTIHMQEKLTYDSFFEFDNLNERLLAGGLFYHENRIYAEGYFYLNILTTNPDEHLLKFQSFEDDFVATLREKQGVKNKGIPEAEVREIVLRRDGGMILIGELSREIERNRSATAGYYGRSGALSMVDYYHDDLFVISIHPTGEEHWKNILHKKQYSQDDDAMYSSYFLLKTPTALRMIFNDEIKMENTVSEYVLTGNGEFDRNAVMSTESQRLRLRFRDAVQVAANEMLVPSENRSQLKLVRVTY